MNGFNHAFGATLHQHLTPLSTYVLLKVLSVNDVLLK